jgi:hypothetical protein
VPIIDADTHVVETERTWEYMDEAEQRYRPATIAAPPIGTVGAREMWLIGPVSRSEQGRIISKGPISLVDTSAESREMADIAARQPAPALRSIAWRTYAPPPTVA